MSKILRTYKAKQVMEGAGVPVARVFGYYELPDFDPFLMLDYFEADGGTDSPGFPWHPHKGIETITYFLKGAGEHQDSMGNKGIISGGELQWMSAGKGVLHQEMPVKSEEGYQGFQFWVNMAAKDKLNAPSYQYMTKDKLQVHEGDGVTVKVICGDYKGIKGPIDKEEQGIVLLHGLLADTGHTELVRLEGKNGYLFIFEGSGNLNGETVESVTAYTLDEGKYILEADSHSQLSFIYAEGIPLNEPIAWHGPVVMNTQEEIRQTFKDLEEGKFV